MRVLTPPPDGMSESERLQLLKAGVALALMDMIDCENRIEALAAQLKAEVATSRVIRVQIQAYTQNFQPEGPR